MQNADAELWTVGRPNFPLLPINRMHTV